MKKIIVFLVTVVCAIIVRSGYAQPGDPGGGPPGCLTIFTVSGGGSICAGQNSATISLSGSQTTGIYGLMLNGSPVGESITGTGSSISWTGIVTGGTYTVHASHTTNTSCNWAMSGSAVVTVNPLPQQVSLTGGGTICAGSVGAVVTLNTSETGVNYQLRRSGNDLGQPKPGTGTAISWTGLVDAGGYAVVATNATSGCLRLASGIAIVTVNPSPPQYNVSGGGPLPLSLSDSDIGVNYQLLVNGASSGQLEKGTGNALTWTSLYSGGIYTVKAAYPATGCTSTMVGSVTVTDEAARGLLMNHWAYQYKYDGRRRVTHKKAPGVDWVYMVYDNRDRLVMSQDGEQRKNKKWNFTKYDELNRPVVTGIYTHSDSVNQAAMSSLISTTNFSESFNGNATNHGYTNDVFPTANTEILAVTYYDDYAFVSEDAYRFDDDVLEGQYRYKPGTAFTGVSGQVTGSKVRTLSGNSWTKSVTYYDDKYRVVQTVASNNKGGIDRLTNLYDFSGKVLKTKGTYSNSSLTWKNVAGMEVTGNTLIKTASTTWGNAGGVSTQTLAAGTNGWMEVTVPENGWSGYAGLSSSDVNYSYTNINYAFHIQSYYYANIRENGAAPPGDPGNISVVPGDTLRIERTGTTVRYYKNGTLLYTSGVSSGTSLMIDCALKETGGALYNVQASFIPATETVVQRSFDYDHGGRLLKTWHSVNNSAPVLLSHNQYNELGQLVTKNLHNTDPSSTPDANRIFKQQLDYRYNIRGWLTRINSSDVSIVENGPPDFWGMNLLYNESASELSGHQPRFDGNLSAMKWSTNLGLASINAMSLQDPTENAYTFRYDTLSRLKSASYHAKDDFGWASSDAYHEKNMMYDLQGNIRRLDRTETYTTPIDQLTYSYAGNQLLKVTDASGDAKGFADGVNTSDDYSYDANGSLSLDRNKNITSITYNHLNLPEKVTKTTGEYVKNTYDATGRKLSQGIYKANGTLSKKTDYSGELFYENDTLKFINHEEGRIIMMDTDPEYQYHLKDHLGNVRLTFTAKQIIEQAKATLEPANAPAEQGEILRYQNARLVQSSLFDHTNGAATGYSARLSGRANEVYGLAKSLSVMPGDTIKMEVFVKYVEASGSNTQALTDFIASIVSGTAPAGTVLDGAGYGSSTSSFYYAGHLNTSASSGTGPKAFLNWLILDKDFNFLDGGFRRVSQAAMENGSNAPHERLFMDTLFIRQPGYVYVYLSNENGTAVEVFFDDFKVEHVKSPVVQMDDYYPFGQSFNSHRREHSFKNRFLYNGKELQNDLGIGWYDYVARQYDPLLGRFLSVDPAADLMRRFSVYTYAYDNPIRFTDPDGMVANDAPSSAGSDQQDPTKKKEKEKEKKETTLEDLNMFEQTLLAYLLGLNELGSTLNELDGKPTDDVENNIMTGSDFLGQAVLEYFGAYQLVIDPPGDDEASSTRKIVDEVEEVVEGAVDLGKRAKQIHGAVNPRTQRSTTIAVGEATTQDGKTVYIVGSNEDNLRTPQRAMLNPGEIEASGPGHAEVTVINYANKNGMKVNRIGASRPICENCTPFILNNQTSPVTPIKRTYIPAHLRAD